MPGSVVSGTGEPSGSVSPGTIGPVREGTVVDVVVVVPAAAISDSLSPDGDVFVGTSASASADDVTFTATL